MTPPAFQLENSRQFALPAGPTTLATYKHASSDFRIVFCPVPGPLVSSAFIVPTLAEGDEGLAHTLEHLIFCGSTINNYRRGYLDYLANRCLSTGTNAYTTEDHTAYTITTAGSEGMLEILPVFLEHVLYPTLREEQFVTEVHHLDGEAKHQGVVYCEMAGRENTEADLLDLAIRRLLFGNQTTYSRECGGLTGEIAQLKNEDIVRYHKRFYHLDNLTTIICGQIDPEAVFQKLTAVEGLLQRQPGTHEVPIIAVPKLRGKPGKVHTQIVKFPSSDEELGSIAFGWRGPPSEDIFTIVALDVLFRYLQETSASPFLQRFVERKDPYASQVDFDLRGFVETAIELVFSGVPYVSDSTDSDAMETDQSDEGSEYSDYESDIGSEHCDGMGEEDEVRDDLFDHGVYHNLMMDVLRDFAANGPSSPNAMQASLSRHRRKIWEALEEDPTESCATYIIPDVVRHYLAAGSGLKDTRAEGGKPVFGTRSEILGILDQLATLPLTFWSDLVKQWLINVPMVEVHMIPDRQMADAHAKKEVEEQDARAKALGKDGLAKLQVKLDEAVKANKVHLTDSVIATMPPVPDVTKAPMLAAKMEFAKMKPVQHGALRPFEACQIVQTETVFANLRLGLHTGQIPTDLRPYLPLFQELIFQSDLTLTTSTGETKVMDYREVARKCADLFVSYEAAVGFGNDVWSASWLSEVFMISASAEQGQWEKLVRFLTEVLVFSTFTEERIVTMAKNLLSNITEIKRDGPDMLNAVCSRVTLPFDNIDRAVDGQKNDLAISVFKQEAFIKDVLKTCKDGNSQHVIDALENIKCLLVSGSESRGPGFVQIAVPRGESGDLVNQVASIWDEQVTLYSKRTPESHMPVIQSTATTALPFPFPRQAYETAAADRTFGNAVVVPIPGVTTTFFAQIVPCDVLRPHPHPDFFAVTLLAEVLSRAEGPLYTAIRGQGYAYDASLHLSLWTGQLSFELYESSEPRRALIEFYDILHRLDTPAGFDETCSRFNVETARASVAYKYASAKSTSGGLVVGALRGALRGFESLEEEEAFQQGLYSVTVEQLRNAYAKYFVRFLDADTRITVATTAPDSGAETLRDQFLDAPDRPGKEDQYKVNFRIVDLKELKV
ncbi:Metalloenzyme, LuxS/M16 peptidase-like protein [Powellomyces hirtus]|nr:Metalloenzyme, LuxS/M16 peptidase-like protein [Powellomyces hirtus]